VNQTDQINHYGSETAGSLALRRVPVLHVSDNVNKARALLKSCDFEAVDLLLLTDASGHYIAAVEPCRLFEREGETVLGTIAREDWPVVSSELDQEAVVDLALTSAVTVMPVVAKDGRPVGLMSALTLMEVLGREHREDVHRVAGILRERAGARHALEDPPMSRVARRLPWLVVGLALSSTATGVMVGFESALQSDVTIAFFIPALVYLADAVGTQTEAIAVRGLSLRDKPLPMLLWSEIFVGGTIGLLLGLIATFAVWLAFGQIGVAVGVGVSLFAAGTLASGIGLLFPWILSRIGVDPAFGAGPVATIVQDVLTIAIYFVVMTKLISVGV
jgi:magnesium transporter